MSHENSSAKEWKGQGRFDNLPSLVAQSLVVTGENGSRCNGSLAVYDSALNRPKVYSWEAVYAGLEKWHVTGRENGTAGDDFSPNRGVNYSLGAFVQERLNQMRRTGAIFQHQPKPAGNNKPAQLGLPPPPALPPKPGLVSSVVPVVTLPGVVDVVPPPLPIVPPAPPPPVPPTVPPPTPAPPPEPDPELKLTASSREIVVQNNTTNQAETEGDSTMKQNSPVVIQAVCAEYNVPPADMQDNRKRGPDNQLCWVRAVIIYLLRELGEKARVALRAVGASEKANAAFYLGYRRVTERMSQDAEFRAIINRLRARVGLDSAATAAGDKLAMAGRSAPLSKGGLEVGNQQVERVLALVSQFVFAPTLLGGQGLSLEGDNLQAVTVWLLFQQGLSPEQISSISAFGVDGVYKRIGLATVLLNQTDSAATALVKKVEKEL